MIKRGKLTRFICCTNTLSRHFNPQNHSTIMQKQTRTPPLPDEPPIRTIYTSLDENLTQSSRSPSRPEEVPGATNTRPVDRGAGRSPRGKHARPQTAVGTFIIRARSSARARTEVSVRSRGGWSEDIVGRFRDFQNIMVTFVNVLENVVNVLDKLG